MQAASQGGLFFVSAAQSAQLVSDVRIPAGPMSCLPAPTMLFASILRMMPGMSKRAGQAAAQGAFSHHRHRDESAAASPTGRLPLLPLGMIRTEEFAFLPDEKAWSPSLRSILLAAEIPETVTAGVPVPITVDSPAK